MAFVSYPLVLRIFLNNGPDGWSERWPLATQDYTTALAVGRLLVQARSNLLCAQARIEWAAIATIEPPYYEQALITDALTALPQWGETASNMQGLLFTLETNTGHWSNHLFRAIDAAEIAAKRWLRRDLPIPALPPPLPADLTTASKDLLFQNTLATFRQFTGTCEKRPPLLNGTPQYWMEPYDTISANCVSSRMVGGIYRRVSWESMARSDAPAFSPCGMAVSVLRRCYAWWCRFYAHEPYMAIRYYWAREDAQVLPIPTIFYGWWRAKENVNTINPGEVGRPPRSWQTNGLGFSNAPGTAYTGDLNDFIGEGTVTWTPYVPTPVPLRPACDAYAPLIVAGKGGLALGGPGVMWLVAIPAGPGGIAVGGAGDLVAMLGPSGGISLGGRADLPFLLRSAGGAALGGVADRLSLLPSSGGVDLGGRGDLLELLAGTGGIALGGLPSSLSPLDVGGGIALGGVGQVLSLLPSDGGLTLGGDSDFLAMVAGQGGILLGGGPDDIAMLSAAGGVALGGSSDRILLLATAGGVALGGPGDAIALVSSTGGIALGGGPGVVGTWYDADAVIEASASTLASSAITAEAAIAAIGSATVTLNKATGTAAVGASATVLASSVIAGEAGVQSQVLGSGLVASSKVSAAANISASFTVLLSDTFTDTNGTALTSHTMNVGSGWASLGGGTWTIGSNQATQTATGGSGSFFLALANAGISSTTAFTACYALITVSTNSVSNGGPELVGWANSSGSTKYGMQCNWNGSTSQLVLIKDGTTVSTVSFTWVNNTAYAFMMVWDGGSIKCYLNGVLKITYTPGVSPTNTYFGIAEFRSSPGVTGTNNYDNFMVYN